MRRRSKIVLVILVAVVIGLGGFVVWAETPLGPMLEVHQTLASDPVVSVSMNQWLVFQPANQNRNMGFIIYPSGRVDYRSYAPLARSVAAEGYLTIIVRMPLNLAVFGANIAKDVIQFYPRIEPWAIGGHSLGGAMAAQFAYSNPSKIKGLVLWASYPASGNNLSKLNIAVVTIHGMNAGLVSTSQIDNSLRLLPKDTYRVEISG